MKSSTNWEDALVAVTGNVATCVVFDTTTSTRMKDVERVVVGIYVDQAVTILHQVRHRGSSTWRTVNGAGDAITASTGTTKEYPRKGFDDRIAVVTGGTGPTVAELSIGLVFERPIGM
jgi:hypothetical protein